MIWHDNQTILRPMTVNTRVIGADLFRENRSRDIPAAVSAYQKAIEHAPASLGNAAQQYRKEQPIFNPVRNERLTIFASIGTVKGLILRCQATCFRAVGPDG
jgi:hypothetical protein